MTVITRRSALLTLGGLAAAACGKVEMPAMPSAIKKLTGPSEDPTAEGKMISRLARRELDPDAMLKDQDKVLRFQRAEAVYGLAYTPEFQRYLDRVAHRLLDKSPAPNLPVHVIVVTSHDWAASVLPPGLIFVPIALLEHLDNEDELAFILAHECSHLLFRHHDSDWLVRSQKQAIAVGELAMAARTTLAPRARDGKLTDTMKAAQASLIASDRIIAPAWSRTQEEQADVLGLDLMILAGYNPEAGVDVLRKMSAWQKGAGKVYQDTPDQLIREESRVDRGQQSGLQPQIQQLWNTALESAQSTLQTLSQSHPDPDKRLEIVQTYYAREYPNVDLPDLTVQAWRAARSQSQTRDVIARYGRAFEAWDRIRDHDARAAERLALESAQGPTSSHNFPRYTLAEVYALTSRRERAFESLRIALEAPEPALESYLTLATLYERAGRLKDSVAVLESARPKFADHPRAWPYLIRLYRRTGREADASQLQLRCQVEFPDFRKLCAGTDQTVAPASTTPSR